ncbi:MAG: HAMP domain-containing protein [Elusimicrobiota bacterium]
MKKRKKILIDREFQSRMIRSVVLLVIASVILSGLITYTIALQIENQNNRKLYGARIEVQEDLVLIERLLVLKPVVIKYLVITGVLSIIVTSLMLFLYSHRLAGPLYHLEKHIESMIEGNYAEKISFRRKDEFKRLADNINKLQETLKDSTR